MENGFLSDNSGNSSSVRLIALLLVVSGIVLIFSDFVLSLFTGRVDIGINIVSAALGMIGLGVTGKVIQKGIEK